MKRPTTNIEFVLLYEEIPLTPAEQDEIAQMVAGWILMAMRQPSPAESEV